MAATAAATAVSPAAGNRSAHADEGVLGDLLVAGIRDAMLGLGGSGPALPAGGLSADFTRALADFDACRYSGLAVRLPRLIRAGHAEASTGAPDSCGLLARSYLLATRMLIKLDEQQLGWMAADRAHGLATTGGDALAVAESARQLAVLARKAGWHTEALSIALTAADHPDLRAVGRAGAAERGLLIQSAAYTVARRGDRDGMRELTDEAAAIAEELGGATLLRDHGGGFSPLTVRLHRISAENHAGDPLAALDAARTVSLKALPSVERRSRCLTDVATALERLGRRQDCVRTLLSAEHHAPEETHARPAVKSLVSSLLVSGPTGTELRGLARRSGVLV
ncbi:XRE family transcriptional regulator [Streptomyces sp. NPDC001493]